MRAVRVTMNLDLDPWRDLLTERHRMPESVTGETGELGVVTRIGLLPDSTKSGRSTVQILVELSDGTLVPAQLTLRNFRLAAAALLAAPQAQMEFAEDDGVPLS